MAWKELPNDSDTALPPGNYRLTLVAPNAAVAETWYERPQWRGYFEYYIENKYHHALKVTKAVLSGKQVIMYLTVIGPTEASVQPGVFVPAQFIAVLILGEVLAALVTILLIIIKVQSIEKDVTSQAKPGSPVGKAVSRISQAMELGAVAAALFAGAYLIRGVH